MEYLYLAFIGIIVIVSIISSVAAKKVHKDVSDSNYVPKRKAKVDKAKANAKGYQPMASHLNTDYSSRLTDIGGTDSVYDTVADIGQESSTPSNSQPLVDFDILYGDDDGNMDISGIATAIVLGEVLGAPKGKR